MATPIYKNKEKLKQSTSCRLLLTKLMYIDVNYFSPFIIIIFPSTYSLSNTNNLNNNINDGTNKSKPKINTITSAKPIEALTPESLTLIYGYNK